MILLIYFLIHNGSDEFNNKNGSFKHVKALHQIQFILILHKNDQIVLFYVMIEARLHGSSEPINPPFIWYQSWWVCKDHLKMFLLYIVDLKWWKWMVFSNAILQRAIVWSDETKQNSIREKTEEAKNLGKKRLIEENTKMLLTISLRSWD